MSPTFEPIPAASPISGPFWTLVVPALLLAVSVAATWMLYRHFSRAAEDEHSASADGS